MSTSSAEQPPKSTLEHPLPVQVTQAATVTATTTGQTAGMTRQSAIVNLSPHVVGTLMRAAPHSSSAIHHHGEQDTIVYAVSGSGAIVSMDDDDDGEGGTGKKEKRQRLEKGDWAIIPAWREHMEVNDGDEECVWVIVRGPGGTPIVQNLEGGWGSSRDVGEGGK